MPFFCCPNKVPQARPTSRTRTGQALSMKRFLTNAFGLFIGVFFTGVLSIMIVHHNHKQSVNDDWPAATCTAIGRNETWKVPKPGAPCIKYTLSALFVASGRATCEIKQCHLPQGPNGVSLFAGGRDRSIRERAQSGRWAHSFPKFHSHQSRVRRYRQRQNDGLTQ